MTTFFEKVACWRFGDTQDLAPHGYIFDLHVFGWQTVSPSKWIGTSPVVLLVTFWHFPCFLCVFTPYDIFAFVGAGRRPSKMSIQGLPESAWGCPRLSVEHSQPQAGDVELENAVRPRFKGLGFTGFMGFTRFMRFTGVRGSGVFGVFGEGEKGGGESEREVWGVFGRGGREEKGECSLFFEGFRDFRLGVRGFGF